MINLLLALLLTIAIECAICAVIYRNKTTIYHTLLANILTNPAMNIILFGIYIFARPFYIYAFIILEIAVIFVEYRVYKYIGHQTKKSITLATALNIASCTIGLLLIPIF